MVIAEFVGLLALEVRGVDTALDSVEEMCIVLLATEVPSEPKSVLILDVDILDGVLVFARLLISDVPETELELVNLAPEFVWVPATSEVLMALPLKAFEVLETGSPLDEVIVTLSIVPENVDPWVMVS